MAGTSWVDFVDNTKARAEDVNKNFDWIQGSIVPMNAGATTNGVYDLGITGKAWKDLFMTGTLYLGGTDTYIKEQSVNDVAIVTDNSTTARFNTTRVDIVNRDLYLRTTQKLYFDGGSDTYIYEASSNSLEIVVAASLASQITGQGFAVVNRDFQVDPTKKIYFDGGNDTWVEEVSANVVNFYNTNSLTLQLTPTGVALGTRFLQITSGQKFYLDGGNDTYIHEESANQIEFVTGNSVTARMNTTRMDIVNRQLYLRSGYPLYFDGGGDTYIYEIAANQVAIVCGGTNHFAINNSLGTVSINSAHLSIPSTKRLYFDSGSDTYVYEASANVVVWYCGGTANLAMRNTDLHAHLGIRIGVDSTNNKLDDSANGASTANLYIGNALISVFSDMRLKKNIEDTKRKSLELIDALRVVDFDWNDKVAENDTRKQRGRYTGMIAQEMIKVAPWAIHHQGSKDCELCKSGKECKKHTEMWQVEYEYLVPILVKAIQELNKRINVLENNNA